MNARVLAAGLLLLLPRAAGAGEICGGVELGGRPLPRGFVRILPDTRSWDGFDEFGRGRPAAGASARGLIRFRGGEFCVKDVAPGNYTLTVSPLNYPEPLGLLLARGGPELASVRLTVPRTGPAEVRDRNGKSLRAGRLELSADARADAGGTRVEGELRFADAAAPAKAAPPALVVAYLRESALTGRYAFQWLTGRPAGGKLRFSLFPVKGELAKIDFDAPGWAKRSDFWRFPGAAKDRVEAVVEAGRSAKVTGTLRLENGAAYRAVRDEDSFLVTLVGFTGQWGLRAQADEDGRFELDAVPGRYEVDSLGRTESGKSGRPTYFLWVSTAGATADVVLKDATAGARVSTKGLGVEVIAGGHDFIVAYPAGPERAISPCGLEAADLYLALDATGHWVREVPYSWGGAADVAWLKPGKYDFYAVRTKDDPWPSLRVVGAVKKVELKAGKTTDVSFEGPAYPMGGAILSGELKPVPDPGYPGLRDARDWNALCALAFPATALFDSRGRFVASVAAGVSEGDGQAFKESIWRHDVAGMDALLARPRSFKLGGLPPGKYRARVSHPSRPAWEAPVVLKQDQETVLSVDTSAPAPR